MLVATILGVLLVPALFVLIESMSAKKKHEAPKQNTLES
jgi:hypothetical protein